MNAINLPLRATMCATCPFRTGSKYDYLADDLTVSALNGASRICHSTGSNAIHYRTGIKPYLCRGARDIQLKLFASLKVIEAPTDEAWNKRRVEMRLKPTKTIDPDEEKTQE